MSPCSSRARLPISHPLVIAGKDGAVYVVFRDEERVGGVSVARSTSPGRSEWRVFDLDSASVGLWEPTYDPMLWRREQRLHLFHQRVGQGDTETLDDIEPQTVAILEWVPYDP